MWDPADRPPPGRAVRVGGDMAGKAAARRAVPRRASALPDLDGPLLVMVSRLVEQKGVDLLRAGARPVERHAVAGWPCSATATGAGRARWPPPPAASRSGSPSVAGLRRRARPTSSSPAATCSLMPSRFEPCGLAQMQAMRYGTLPGRHRRRRAARHGRRRRRPARRTGTGVVAGSADVGRRSSTRCTAACSGARAAGRGAGAMQQRGMAHRLVVARAGPAAPRALPAARSTTGTYHREQVHCDRTEPKRPRHRPGRR